MAGTISTAITTSYTLGVNPTTILSTGAVWVTSTSAAVTGGAGTAWTLINQGQIENAGSSFGAFGVLLASGGSVSNAASGTIISSNYSAIYIEGGNGTVTNAGTIAGLHTAVRFAAGYVNRLVVDPGASFSGSVDGGNTFGSTSASTLELASGASPGTLTGLGSNYIDFAQVTIDSGATWTLVSDSGGVATYVYDSGTLINTGSIFSNVSLFTHAVLSNAVGGTISSTSFGVDASGVPATVINAGYIHSGGIAAVYLNGGGGNVTNQSGGTITGNFAMRVVGAPGTVVNAGYMEGANSGAYLNGSGLSNASGGTIIGASYGVENAGSGTVINAGYVHGGFGVQLSGGGSLINASGGTIFGTSYGVNVITAAATVVNAGTISGSSGALRFEYGFANRLIVDPGAVFIGNVLGRAGALELASGASIGTLAGVGTQFTDFAQTTIDSGAAWTLTFPSPSSAQGGISGFAAGDALDLAGVDPASVTLSSGTLAFAGGSFPLSLAGAADVQAVSDGAGGALVVTVACFREGTRIRTPEGDVLVEDLRVGDEVATLRGAAPIIWIGHRSIDCSRHPQPRNVWPVRIAKDAFSDGLPCRDLFLSPDHAVFADGTLIPVKHLINGTNIVQVPVKRVTYYHVELARHGVLLAEGLPAESYLDTGQGANLAAGDLISLHPDFASRAWEAMACAPLVVAGPTFNTVRSMLQIRESRPSPGAALG